ncbi:hypothetical protein M9Y10_025551 [Tritrichomonas musculus]|uniref:E2F/DP family winged-helix DNA-binding domain-containing protein n=1 Tax=Tritrichomonas musculus TaxID=1915356 RepID=A0ABR2HBE3_9EUKA
MTDAKKQKNKICLKNLAPHTMELIRDLKTTTSEDIATCIIEKLTFQNPGLKGQDTIKRRIYDVINVLSAAGVIDKVGKQIIYQGTSPFFKSIPVNSSVLSESDIKRIQNKEKLLESKIALLTLFKALIQRNFILPEPENRIKLPAILVGVKEPSSTILKHPLVRTEIEFTSKEPMVFLAPSEVLMKINLPKESIKAFLEASPDYARYAQSLLQ